MKINHVVSNLVHTNNCAVQKCSDLCEYIKWFISHRKKCAIPCKGGVSIVCVVCLCVVYCMCMFHSVPLF